MDSQHWELMFGKQNCEGPERAAPTDVVIRSAASSHNEQDSSYYSMTKYPTFNQQTTSTVSTTNCDGSQPSVEDPAHLVRYVMLVAGVDVNSAFQFLKEFVQTHQKNFKVVEDDFSILSIVFDGTLFAQFRIQIFSHGRHCGVCVHVMEGQAQDAVTEFWRKLKIDLTTSDFVDQVENEDALFEDEAQSEDDDFFASWDRWGSDAEDEEETPSLSLSIPSLNKPNLLETDYVDSLMEDLQDQNFMMHSILLLAWNCQLQQNLETISSAGQAQQLFDAIITCLVASAADFCLPIARSASLLVHQLVDTGAIKITEAQFEVLVNTIVQWTIQNSGDSDTITQSEEIAQLLTSQLTKLDVAANSAVRAQLQEVYTRAPFQSVRQNIKPLVEAF